MIDALEQPKSLQILVLVRTDEGPRTHNQSVFMSTHFYNCILFFLPKKLLDADCCTINYEQDISPTPPSLLFSPVLKIVTLSQPEISCKWFSWFPKPPPPLFFS